MAANKQLEKDINGGDHTSSTSKIGLLTRYVGYFILIVLAVLACFFLYKTKKDANTLNSTANREILLSLKATDCAKDMPLLEKLQPMPKFQKESLILLNYRAHCNFSKQNYSVALHDYQTAYDYYKMQKNSAGMAKAKNDIALTERYINSPKTSHTPHYEDVSDNFKAQLQRADNQ